MRMVSVTCAVTGNARAQLENVIAKLSHTGRLALHMAERAAVDMRRNIDERHAPDGTKYDDLSDFTLRRRGLEPHFTGAIGNRGASFKWSGNHPNGDAPLKDTGRMYDSITAQSYGENEAWAGPHALDAWYFAFQNQGTKRRGNFRKGETVEPGIPARPFIGVSITLFEQLQSDTAIFVEDAFAGVGGIFND